MKILKWIGSIFGVILLSLLLTGFLLHEPKPAGQASEAADRLAQKMLSAINITAWDTTAILQWQARRSQIYLWDRTRNFVRVKWGNTEVLLNTQTITGKAYKDGNIRPGQESDDLVKKAWKYFCNDSFWLNAPAKVFDPGTVRSLVRFEDGREGLMVTYQSGGVTPGDSYVWFPDETGLPQSWKMWAEILLIGGLEFTWENWITMPTGAKIATRHNSTLLDFLGFSITDVKGAGSLAESGLNQDPFAAISDTTVNP